MVERIIVINAMVNGARIIPHPLMFKPKYGPKNTNIRPFKTRDPIPKVQTSTGMNILLRSGHNTALKILMKNMNSRTLKKLVIVKFNPKLIKYNPIKFAANNTKYLLADSPDVFLSSSMSLIFLLSYPNFFIITIISKNL